MRPRFLIRVLGAWRIERANRFTDLPPHERALILKLGLSGDRGAAAQTLIYAGWGQHHGLANDGKSALYTAVSSLRDKLGDTDRSIITSSGQLTRRYRLHIDPSEMDFLQFQHHYRAARQLLAQAGSAVDPTGHIAETMQHQRQGLHLWCHHNLVAGLPDACDPMALADNASLVDRMRIQMLGQYLSLAAQHGGLDDDEDLDRLIEPLLATDVSAISPLLLADLLGHTTDPAATANLISTVIRHGGRHADIGILLNHAVNARITPAPESVVD